MSRAASVRDPDRAAVRMFGPLRVELADRTLGARDFGGVKPKQLLEVLLVERGRVMSKDQIADRLWGEALPRNVMATIENYVSMLRRALDVPDGAGRRRIVTEHGGYRMPTELLDVDADRFEERVRSAERGELGQRAAALSEAVATADDELLTDEPDAKWVAPPRAHYAALLIQALGDLAECQLALADHRAAIGTVDRLLRSDPLAERGYRMAMLAHYALGDRDGALRRFEECRSVLADALGVDPMPETSEVHVGILSGVPAATLVGGPPEAPWTERLRTAPPVRFADAGGVRIAYQVVGDGPVDLVFAPSFISNLGATWDDPTYAAFLRELAAMSRLILFDKRGTGLSDPVADFPTQRERSEDLRCVIDAAGSDRAVMFGVCGGGGLSVQFAADHPDRIAGLILHNSAARTLCDDDYPWGLPAEVYEKFLASFEELWLDEGDRIAQRNPGLVDNPRYRGWFAHYVRLAANPYLARRLAEMNAQIDNRDLLPRIGCPALVITRTRDAWLSPENSRYLARHIPGAELLELPGVDHDPWVGDTAPVLQAVREFLTHSVTK